MAGAEIQACNMVSRHRARRAPAHGHFSLLSPLASTRHGSLHGTSLAGHILGACVQEHRGH